MGSAGMLPALSGTLSDSFSVVRPQEIGIDKIPRPQETAGNMPTATSRMLPLSDPFDFSVTKMRMCKA
jgi:hypothetical protein